MTCDLAAVCIRAVDPRRVGLFWAALLRRQTVDRGPAGVELLPSDGGGFAVRFVPTPQAKAGQNLMHFDLTSSSAEDHRSTVDAALRLGGQHRDVGQRGDEPHVVLGDVEGNEFCVIEPGNAFLAGCGFIGALSCDGSPEVGHFWAAALDWPLVWDQDSETAIQSPSGGPKITWGGPPPMPRTTADRVFLEVVPTPDSAHGTEIDRMVALGASRRSAAAPDPGGVDLSDPDGNLFRVLVTP